jgi:tetratricopeptide (TPR) repeat protein
VSLLDKAFEERKRRPGRIEVADPGLERLFSEHLRGCDIDVALREKLPGVDEFLAGMASRFGGPQMPGVLEVPGVTVESMRSFAEAARAFYEATPWRLLSDRDLIEIRGGAPPGFSYAVVLGMGGLEQGLGFFDDKQAFWGVVAGEKKHENLWNVTFGTIADLPLGEANLFVDHGLDVAGPNAYPIAFCVQSKNRVRRPSPRILEFLTGFLKVLAESGAAEIDQGRWKRTASSIAGPRDYELVLPFLLEPPTPGELARRRILPDPRAFERLHSLLHRKFAELLVQSAEEIEEILARELGDRSIDEISCEPRNDRDRAQEICFQAFDAWGRRRGQLVEEALSLDPGSVDALVLKAERTPDSAERRELYETAVASGEERAAESAPRASPGELWTHYATRPYLRALHSLAHELENQGRSADAIDRYGRLLRLDEGDHQGIRYCLLSCLLLAGEFREAENHVKEHQSPDECVWLYARALAAFGRYGDGARSRKAIEKAIHFNPFAADRLLGGDERNSDPEMEDDADSCEQHIGEAWSETRGALDWLEEHYEEV